MLQPLQGLTTCCLCVVLLLADRAHAALNVASGTCTVQGPVIQCASPRWYAGSARVADHCLKSNVAVCYERGTCTVWCAAAGYGACVGYLIDAKVRATQYPDTTTPSSNALGFQWVMCITATQTTITHINAGILAQFNLATSSQITASCAASSVHNEVLCTKVTYGSGNHVDICYVAYSSPNVYVICGTYTAAVLCAALGYGSYISSTTVIYSKTQYETGGTCTGSCTGFASLTCALPVKVTATAVRTASLAFSNDTRSPSTTQSVPLKKITTSPHSSNTYTLLRKGARTRSVTLVPHRKPSSTSTRVVEASSGTQGPVLTGQPSTAPNYSDTGASQLTTDVGMFAPFGTSAPTPPQAVDLGPRVDPTLQNAAYGSATVAGALSPTFANKPGVTSRLLSNVHCRSFSNGATFPLPDASALMPAAPGAYLSSGTAGQAATMVLNTLALCFICFAWNVWHHQHTFAPPPVL